MLYFSFDLSLHSKPGIRKLLKERCRDGSVSGREGILACSDGLSSIMSNKMCDNTFNKFIYLYIFMTNKNVIRPIGCKSCN